MPLNWVPPPQLRRQKMRVIERGGSQESERRKGLKQAKAKARKGKEYSRHIRGVAWGGPPSRWSHCWSRGFSRPQPRSHTGWTLGALFTAPAHCPHRGPPPAPPQGPHEVAVCEGVVHVLRLPCACVSACVCCMSRASKALCLWDSSLNRVTRAA